jgi:hypothetical protein
MSEVKMALDRAPASDPVNGGHHSVPALDAVAVGLHAPVVEEHAQAVPVVQQIAQRLGHRHLARHAAEPLLHKDLIKPPPPQNPGRALWPKPFQAPGSIVSSRVKPTLIVT